MTELREFKFRGCTKSGKFVYGDLIHKDEKVLIRTSKSYRYHEVAPESISQLVGHDCDGAEVYEGDTLEDTLIGNTFVVSVHAFPNNAEYLKLRRVLKCLPLVQATEKLK